MCAPGCRIKQVIGCTVWSDNKLVIVEMYEGFSAEKAGLKVGDEIIKIDDVFIEDFNNKQVATLLKGSPNSTVDLVVKRQDKTLEFKVKREKITIDPVPHHQMITDEIGYIAFNRFSFDLNIF